MSLINSKYCILFLICLHLFSCAFTQAVEDLEQKLRVTSSDAERIKVLVELSKAHLSSDLEKASSYADKALVWAKLTNDSSLLMEALNVKTRILLQTDQVDSAYAHIILMKEMAHNNDELYLMALANESYFHWREGNISAAESTTISALKIASKLEDNESIRHMNFRLGQVYLLQRMHEKAETHFLEAIEVGKKGIKPLTTTYRELIRLYIESEKYEKADSLLDMGFEIAQKHNHNVYIADFHRMKGLCEMSFQNMAKAKFHLDTSLVLMQEVNVPFFLCEVYLALSKWNRLQGNYPEAKEYFNTLKWKLLEFKSDLLYPYFYEEAIELYKAQGIYDTAFIYLKHHKQHLDSTYQIQRLEMASSLQATYEAQLSTQFKLYRNKILQQEVNNQKIFIIAILLFVALLVATSIYFYNNSIRRKRVNEALEEAKNAAESATIAKDRFLANMSHEIRTPMNAVIGLTEVLLDTPVNERQKDYLKTIQNSGETLLAIINDILDFSKIESGKLELEARSFVLRDNVEDVAVMLAHKINAKDIELIIDISEKTPEHITTDPFRLNQILFNLLGNATKFTNEGEIIVKVNTLKDDNGEFVLFAVSDTGIGIPADKMDKLFTAFSQVDASTTRKFGGTGLGLSITKKLVDLMGGEIWVESSPGIGSIFYFTLPVSSPKGTADFDGAEPETLADKTVLILEGNYKQLNVLKRNCESWKMNVIAINTPQELERLFPLEKKPDIILLNHDFPSTVLFNWLSGTGNTYNKPIPLILMLPGTREPEHEDRRIFTDSLNKPYKKALLFTKLKTALSEDSLESVPRNENGVKTGHKQKLGLKILLVEDNKVNQKVIHRMLDKIGCEPDIANDGVEALEMIEKLRYDLVFMDIQMPRLDGIGAMEKIIQRWPDDSERPIVIAMTANARKEDREICLRAGMQDFVSKPVRKIDLETVIGKWFPGHLEPKVSVYK